MRRFDHSKIEAKWWKKWQTTGIYRADDSAAGMRKKKFYGLIEFPYPSGDGLHIGHPRSFTAMDIIARKRRMEGYNVLYPIGWDAFGLPTENYAVKTGIHPKIVTKKNTDTFRRQLQSLGFSFDWSREINTTDPAYYKWTQWIFLQMWKRGLAYKKKMPINWCPRCKIGLANEEVVNGNCERCGHPVEEREKEQWLLAITKYADRLLQDLDKVDYLERIRIQQQNWIGKSEGALIKFPISHSQLSIEVFTTRPDTLFGATFMVIAPEHELLSNKKVEIKNRAEIEKYVKRAKQKSQEERTAADKEKTGIEIKGIRAINPANKKEIPIFVADYVLGGYGTGAIMAVPAHDERDFAFAKKYKLPVVQVVRKKNIPIRSYLMGAADITDEDLKRLGIVILGAEKGGDRKIEIPEKSISQYERLVAQKMTPGFWNEYFFKDTVFLFKHKNGKIQRIILDLQNEGKIDDLAAKFCGEKLSRIGVWGWLAENSFYTDLIIHNEDGHLINSGKFTGMDSEKAKWEITKFVGGKKESQYHLRDWIFSRQRYWGEPIPLVFCEKEKEWVPVSEKDLPVKLPDVKEFKPTDTGESPLARETKWINTKCPRCKGPARRETDTMPNWAGSSWYFLRYIDPKSNKVLGDAKKLKYWMPVDWYNGGMEHTTLHLLYSRFWNKFLCDIGIVPVSEPYQKRTSHGLILGEGGEKMSKSRGNVINPDALVKEFGADAVRIYEMFMGPFDQAIAWDHRGLIGVSRFLARVWDAGIAKPKSKTADKELERALHRAIKKVDQDIEVLAFNTAVSSLMVLVNKFGDAKEIPQPIWEKFLVLLAPFAPFMAEELWSRLKKRGSVHQQPWPAYDPKLIEEDRFELVIQINGKIRDKVELPRHTPQKEAEAIALNRDKIKQIVAGVTVRKMIFVPNRLLNIVIEA